MANISAAVLLDVILIAFVLFSVIYGAMRGFVKSVWKIAALVLTIILVMLLKTPFTSMLAQTPTADNLYRSISEKITPVFSENMYNGEISSSQKREIAKTLRLPESLVSRVLKDNGAQAAASGTARAVERAADNIARSITMMILGFVSAVILFILIKIGLFILRCVLDAFTELPFIHGTNKFLGAFMGLISAMLIVFTVTAIFAFTAADNADVYEMVKQTYIVKHFYNNNILLNLFMRI